MPKKKPKKPVEEMRDRDLAEHLLGKDLVERLHDRFDLRDTSEEADGDFTPSG